MERLEGMRVDFERDGYAIARGLLSDGDLQPVRDVIARHVDRLASELVTAGRVDDPCAGAPFDRRWARLCALARRAPGGTPLPWIWGGAALLDRAIYDLYTDPRLTGLAAALLGPEVTANGDFWVRPKTPGDPATTLEWHQDSFYCGGVPSPGLTILSLWIPLVDVDAGNGCLDLIPGSHRHGPIPSRRNEAGHAVPLYDLALYGAPRTEPMRVGDVMAFHNLVLHASGTNATPDQVRWSIDLRYMRTGTGFAWHSMGDGFDANYPCFVARSDDPARLAPWEDWRDRWRR